MSCRVMVYSAIIINMYEMNAFHSSSQLINVYFCRLHKTINLVNIKIRCTFSRFRLIPKISLTKHCKVCYYYLLDKNKFKTKQLFISVLVDESDKQFHQPKLTRLYERNLFDPGWKITVQRCPLANLIKFCVKVVEKFYQAIFIARNVNMKWYCHVISVIRYFQSLGICNNMKNYIYKQVLNVLFAEKY